MKLWFKCLISLLALALLSCGKPNEEFVDLNDYENDAAEAVARRILKDLPLDNTPFNDGAPKVYCLVKEPGLLPVSAAFADRLKDTGLTFVSADNLVIRPEDKRIIETKSHLSPVFVQIRKETQKSLESMEIEGAWAYKDHFAVKLYAVKSAAKGWEVSELKVLEAGEHKGLQKRK